MKYQLKTVQKTTGQLLLGGNITSSNPEKLVFQLTDLNGTEISCVVRTTVMEGNEGTVFVLFAELNNNETVFLKLSDENSSEQVRIDPAFLKRHKRNDLWNKFNARNIIKAKKFIRENGLKNAVLRTNSEVRKETEDMDYDLWKQFHDPTKEELEEQKKNWNELSFENGKAPLISIVIPAYNTNKEMLLLLLDSIKTQTYPVFEALIADGSSENNSTVRDTLADYSKIDSRFVYVPVGGNKGISGNTNAGLEKATGDFIAFSDHDDELPQWTLYEIAKAIAENPRVQFLYTDEDKVDEDGSSFFDPHFKSDFNPMLLETCNYISHFNVVRRDLLEKAGFLSSDYDGSQDYDFVLRCSELVREEEHTKIERFRKALLETSDVEELSQESGLLVDSVRKLLDGRFISELAYHIPKVCYHWRCSRNSTALDSKAKVYAFEAGRKAVQDHLLRCHADFREVVNSPISGFYRIKYADSFTETPLISVLVRNQDRNDLTKRCIDSLQGCGYPELEIIRLEDPSETVQKPTGEYVLLLDNRLILKDNNSLYEMLGILKRENVGAVGARIVDERNATWSAGQVLTEKTLTMPAFSGFYEYQGSYMHRMMSPQNYSALDGACILMQRRLFEQLGGTDEAFQTDLAFTDLCLRLRQRGYLLVYTPYAVFERKDTFGEKTGMLSESVKMEQEAFRQKWAGFLKHSDPYYNPQFLSEDAGFHIGLTINDIQE